MKTCSKCNESKNISDFYKNKGNRTPDELHSWCKECCREDQNKRARDKRIKNPQYLRDMAKKWRDANRLKYRKMQNEYHSRRRLKILTHYSNGIPKCACCGEREIKFLSIDHIDGGGLKQGREMGFGRGGLSNWIIKNNFPKGFQILCHNCNFSKGHYGQCPHKLNK